VPASPKEDNKIVVEGGFETEATSVVEQILKEDASK
jgi:hypothetical protein